MARLSDSILRGIFGQPGRAAARIDDSTWQHLLDASPLFDRLGPEPLHVLRLRCEAFLERKRFCAGADHELTEFQCLCIAALACLPAIGLGIDCLDNWTDVIVYPGSFKVRGEHHDPETGVVTEFEDSLIGEAWSQGPLVVSWADIAEDLEHPFDGFNVVIHEVAHKLDMRDGEMNGIPQLPQAIDRSIWMDALTRARSDLASRIDRGESTLIDPYAAESPEEFFAVASEVHFSAPALLQAEWPQFADLLERLYGRGPADGD